MKVFYSLFFLAFYLTVSGQDKNQVILTLDDCINTALEKNITIKRSRNNELIARANKFQSLMNYLPSLNASGGYQYYFGTFFDQTAFKQVTEATETSRPSITASWDVFTGFSKIHLQNQREAELVSAEEGVKAAEINTKAGILNSYLSVIVDRENMNISAKRVELLERQLDRAIKRESVGVGGMEDVYNFKSQLATEKLSLQMMENTFRRDLLILIQQMQLDPTAAEYSIAEIAIEDQDLTKEIEPFNKLLGDLVLGNPSVNAAKANFDAAKYQLKAARASAFPRLTSYAVLGSEYSSNGALNPNKIVVQGITDEGDTVRGFRFEPNATYVEQMGYNEYQVVGLTLNIPIFNQFSNGNRIQVSKINLANAELSVNEAVNTITNSVQQVYLDLVAAQTTYESAKENLEALEASFDFMEKRYEAGNTDFYTYLESLNNKNRAEIQLINAKYGIILRQKVLDTYRVM